MSQSVTIQRLTEKISQIEQELQFIRQELAELRQINAGVPPTAGKFSENVWSNKQDQKQFINNFFILLAIQGEPIGAQSLQQRMALSGLANNELTRDIIAAREE
jgi:hypothetical protein